MNRLLQTLFFTNIDFSQIRPGFRRRIFFGSLLNPQPIPKQFLL